MKKFASIFSDSQTPYIRAKTEDMAPYELKDYNTLEHFLEATERLSDLDRELWIARRNAYAYKTIVEGYNEEVPDLVTRAEGHMILTDLSFFQEDLREWEGRDPESFMAAYGRALAKITEIHCEVCA